MSLADDLQALWARRRWRYTLIGLAVLAAGVALAGGFARAPSKGVEVPESRARTRVTTGVLAITPLCAWASDLRPGQPDVMRGTRRYLVLRARVENLGDDWLARSAYLGQDVVWLADGRSDPRDPERLQRADDHGLDVILQPALPTTVDLVWHLPPSRPVPARAVFGVYKRRFVERGYLSGEQMWVQDGPGHRLPLAVGATCDGAAA